VPQREQFDVLILRSGQGGRLLAWHMARSGQRTAVAERQWVGRSCPAVACMPNKNETWSARVAHVAQTANQFGAVTGTVKTDMAEIHNSKQGMIERGVAFEVNAAILPSLCRQRGAAATARPRLRSGQLPAHAGFARGGEAKVTDHAAHPADETRREGRRPRPFGLLPDGLGRGVARVVADHPPRYWGCSAVAAGPMLRIAALGGPTSISGTPARKSRAVDRKARLLGVRYTAKERPMGCDRGSPCRTAWAKTTVGALNGEIDGCLRNPGSTALSSAADPRSARTRKAERAMNHPFLPYWPAQSALARPQLRARTSEQPLGKMAWSCLRQGIKRFTWFIVRWQTVVEWGVAYG